MRALEGIEDKLRMFMNRGDSSLSTHSRTNRRRQLRITGVYDRVLHARQPSLAGVEVTW